MRAVLRFAALLILLAGFAASAQSSFATRVVAYDPAPGQFVNDPLFNDPGAALGPPTSAGQEAPTNLGVVTLGGFGGSITLAFDHTVIDDPRNPRGLDAIVFGNAYWVGGDPNARWGEAVTIEISLDTNGNGVADDAWFLIPGSHLPDPGARFAVQTWDTHTDDPAHPPHLATWIPAGATPDANGRFETAGWMMPHDPFETFLFLLNPNGVGARDEGVWGYGDCSPTRVLGDLDGDGVTDAPWLDAEAFYTRPDDPFTVGIDAGAGGGDAFDIAWAIDPLTGAGGGLPGFDFIRLTSARRWSVSVFGEASGEIDAVADVAPVRPGSQGAWGASEHVGAVRVWGR